MPKKITKGGNLHKKVIAGLSIVAIIALLFGSQSVVKPKPTPTPTPTQTPTVVVVSNTNAKCHIKGVLPDPDCTPGSVDPNVTQDNIQETICVSGYTKTVRPSANYTNKLKIQQITEYGYSDTNTKDYEEDHLISLELGGSPSDPKNLWPEPGDIPNPKDKVENRCHKLVCSNKITLKEAQKQIATDWTTACPEK